MNKFDDARPDVARLLAEQAEKYPVRDVIAHSAEFLTYGDAIRMVLKRRGLGALIKRVDRRGDFPGRAGCQPGDLPETGGFATAPHRTKAECPCWVKLNNSYLEDDLRILRIRI